MPKTCLLAWLAERFLWEIPGLCIKVQCSHPYFTGSLVASIFLLQETCLLEEPSVLGSQFQASLSPGITISYQSQLSARDCIFTSELLGLHVSMWEMRSNNKGGTKAIFFGWLPMLAPSFSCCSRWLLCKWPQCSSVSLTEIIDSEFSLALGQSGCLHGAHLLLFSCIWSSDSVVSC